MQVLLTLVLLWLGPAIAALSDERALRSGGVSNNHPGNKHRKLQTEFDPDRLALFFETVNAELESQNIRGAAYAFRGPVR
jgi:hypothetical protein